MIGQSAAVRALMAVLLPLTVGCGPVAPSHPAAHAAEELAASIERQRSAEQAHTEALAAALAAQPRTEPWARRKEDELRRSYEAAAGAVLRRIDCRTTRCELSLSLAAEDAAARVEQARAVEQWVAWEQPCDFTMAHDVALGEVRLFLVCGSAQT